MSEKAISPAPRTAPVLDYDRPSLEPLPSAWRTLTFRFANGCWAVPLLSGLAIFLCMKISGGHLDPWAPWGLLNIAAGTVLALGGWLAVMTSIGLRWGRARNRWSEVIWPALAVCLLLLSNFAVAFLLIILSTH